MRERGVFQFLCFAARVTPGFFVLDADHETALAVGWLAWAWVDFGISAFGQSV
jgi:hypothetical protein